MIGTLNKGSLVKGTGGSGGGGSSSATINYFDNITGTTLDTQLTLGNSVMVFKNGVLLQPTEDYSISGSVITFITALVSTDKIAVINGNLDSIDLTPYLVKPTILTDETPTSMALAGNTIYKWTSALTSLSFASAEVSDLETVLYFTTGGTITFTDSSSLKWGGDGSAPSLEANTIYCISIRNGLAEIDTFGTVS